MNVDMARLRRFAPVAAFLMTVSLGWMVVVRPVSAERARTEDRLGALQQREAALHAMVTEPSPPAVTIDPVAAFERRVAVDDPTAAIVERLARLAWDTRARDLFIETVDGRTATGAGAPPLPDAYRPDPRVALFDLPLSHTSIRMSFETDYASLGRLLWDLRDLPTVVEIRTLNVQPRLASSGDEHPQRDGMVRASMTFYAYSRLVPAPASGATVTP